MSDKEGPHVRLRTAGSDKKKALDHYQELRRSGKVSRAVVIAEDNNGDITILGQMLKPDEVFELIVTAGMATNHIFEKQKEIRREPLNAFLSAKGSAGPALKTKEVTTAEDNTLVPPPGEHFIGCGECGHSRFYVLMRDVDDQPSRYSCAHCGNEIKLIKVPHKPGNA